MNAFSGPGFSGPLDNFLQVVMELMRQRPVGKVLSMEASGEAMRGKVASSDVSSAQSPVVSEWLRAARGGDGDAYQKVIQHYQPLMAKRMCRFTRDRVLLEELVQEVFVEAYFSLKRFRGDAPFEHWLQRIATRVGYQFWKRQKRERVRAEKLQQRASTMPMGSEDAEPEEESGGGAFGDATRLLEKLSARDRLVLTLIYLEGKSVEEAAAMSGWSKTMVKVQAFRARGKLRKMIEAETGKTTETRKHGEDHV